MNIIDAIKDRNYTQAAELVKVGQKKEIKNALKEARYFQEPFMHAPGLSLIEALVDKGLIALDVYEFNNIPFSMLGRIIDYLKQHATPENIEGFKSLLQKTDNIDESIRGLNLVDYAIQNNVPIEIIEALFSAGCDVHIINERGENYIHRVVSRSSFKYRMDPNNQTEAYIRFFTGAGIDINVTDKLGQTPLLSLIMTANCYDKDVLIILLESGADVDVEAPDGKNAVDLAFIKQDIEMFKILQEYGAVIDNDKQDKEQQSIIYRFLNSISYEMSGTECDLFEILLDSGFDPYQINKDSYQNEQYLLDLVVQKSPQVLEQILEYTEFDINEPDQEGNTTLHKVCSFDINYDQRKAKDLYRKVKILIKEGADVALQNNKGLTARELAAMDERKHMAVAYLLKHELQEGSGN
jgi:ankyrin repeat protein